MTIFHQVETSSDFEHVRELFSEYLRWVHKKLNEEYGIDFDLQAKIEADMGELDMFSPPKGRLILALIDSAVVGMGSLRDNGADIGEIKRMYVRPAHRGKGVGRGLLEHLTQEASRIGYRRLRLDSTLFMHEAHALYRSAGFREIDAYPESEIPQEIQDHWIFMEKVL